MSIFFRVSVLGGTSRHLCYLNHIFCNSNLPHFTIKLCKADYPNPGRKQVVKNGIYAFLHISINFHMEIPPEDDE